jgi:hypothetical protein
MRRALLPSRKQPSISIRAQREGCTRLALLTTDEADLPHRCGGGGAWHARTRLRCTHSVARLESSTPCGSASRGVSGLHCQV